MTSHCENNVFRSLENNPTCHSSTKSLLQNACAAFSGFSHVFRDFNLENCASLRVAQQVDNEFVSGEDNGCVGDLSDQLWNQSSVKSCVAFLHRYQPPSLEEIFVFAAFLPQPRSDDLCGDKTKQARISCPNRNSWSFIAMLAREGCMCAYRVGRLCRTHSPSKKPPPT